MYWHIHTQPLVAFKGYSWNTQFRRGAEGVTLLSSLLREDGMTVVEKQDMTTQRRGIDLHVNEEWWEVKSDSHEPSTLFLEMSCNNKPGCIFMSRADKLAYFYPAHRTLRLYPMPHVQWYLAKHWTEHAVKTITSTRNGRTWSATGIVVPSTFLDHEEYIWPSPLN